jgi:hypothetical protein
MLPTTLTNSYFTRIAHTNVTNTSHFLRQLEGAVVHLLTYIAIPGLGTEASRQAGKGILYSNIYLLTLFSGIYRYAGMKFAIYLPPWGFGCRVLYV